MNDLRHDLLAVANFVPIGAKVLDLGCGDGELIEYLQNEKNVDARGIEISHAKVTQALKRGLAVVQGNVDSDLAMYPDQCFDYVLSSQVLQATHQPKEVLQQMLRVAKRVIIGIPNFGHWRNRFYFTFNGMMPVTKTLSYQWYETPNIHFCTAKDFEVLCHDIGATIESKHYINANSEPLSALQRALSVNMFSDKAIYVISV